MTDAEWWQTDIDNTIYGSQNLDFEYKHLFFKQLTINKDNEIKQKKINSNDTSHSQYIGHTPPITIDH